MFGSKRNDDQTGRTSSAPSPAPGTTRLVGLWTDSLGRAGTRSAQALLVLISVIAVIFASIQLKLVVIPVLLALILSSAVSPLVSWMSKRMPRALATVISLLSGLLVFGGIITIVVASVQSQWDSLATSVSDGIDQVVDFVQNGPLPIDTAQIDSARQSVIDFLTSSQFGSGALAGATAAIELITGTVLAVFILFYFTKDGPQIFAFLIQPFTARTHAKARRAGDRAVAVLGGYVRGTAIVATVDAVLIGVALAILQVPLALPLAILVFIGAFIPIVGATVAGVVAALVALVTVDLNAAIIVGVVVIAVNQLEGNFLAPVVLGKSLKLHELVVLLALTAGAILGGIVGTLLSVPIAAVTWAIIKAWNEEVPPVPGVDMPKSAQECRERQLTRRSCARTTRFGRSLRPTRS